ncbi:hypothetical protein KKF81_00560 [Candidatus Micrarchaeota archaeon]|nr:hypothetical protein [Candidatus Micrarchaeota archaeon]MBU1165410.1 hypothetical protein [Candidatus Micrarchaeota archaeon]MBU1886274.1 hypothetical protein [Candidatus Micrarchaeota archaeon]
MKSKILILILLVCSLAFADVGPSPDPPQLIVTFTKSNLTYDGPVELIYHCNLLSDDSSPIGEREVELSCNAGLCTNPEWFYKLNPCFDHGGGQFLYKESGSVYSETTIVSFDNRGARFEINLDTGEINQFPHDNGPDNLSCFGVSAFIFLICFSLFVRN